MQDGGKEKTLCVHFLHVYPEADDLGSSQESLLAMAPNHWGWQRGLLALGSVAENLHT